MAETDSQPIAENEQVKELLALLKDNNTPGYEEFAKLIEHVTGMEQHLLEATEELKAVRQEMQGLQNHSLKDALQKRCFPFLTMVYSACSMETGTGTLLFAIVWMTPMQKLTG